MPGGVGGIWPFIADELVVLPSTLPQDHTLFVVLGQTNGEVWKRKLDFIAARSGLALMLTHPDYLQTPHTSEVYREFPFARRRNGAITGTPCPARSHPGGGTGTHRS